MDIYFSLMIIMLGHWIGDFVFQDDRMSLNKSEDSNVLMQHCLIYAVVITLFFFIAMAGTVKIGVSILFLMWMVLSHFAIDFVTARANKKLWLNNQRHYFFVMVGFDQFLHMCTILVFIKMMVM